MTTISPLISSYSPPFKGMDTRTVKPSGSPALLLNVDLSDRGSIKQRPGSRIFANASSYLTGSPTAQNPCQPKGMFAYYFDNKLYIFLVVHDPINHNIDLLIYGDGGQLRSFYGLDHAFSGQPAYDLEPKDKSMGEYQYVFVATGRFVYFSNGIGNFYKIEIKEQLATNASFGNHNYTNFEISSNAFEEGVSPLALSYFLDGLSPSSLTYFYDQIVASGFKKRVGCGVSLPIKPKDEKEDPIPPEQLISVQRDVVTVDQACVYLSEPYLFDSYPSNDPNGFFWLGNENIIASVGLGTEILIFTENALYKIVNPTAPLPRRVKVMEVSLAGPKAYCYFKNYLFFVATDGCYVATASGGVKKVSNQMDDLWFSRRKPDITRYTESRIKDTAYPYYIDEKKLVNCHCVNDKRRQQVMVSLTSLGGVSNNMVWVFNYSDMLEGMGDGKWSIWTSGDQTKYTTTSLSPGSSFPASTASRPDVDLSNISYNVYNWGCSTEVTINGEQRIFFVSVPSVPNSGVREQTRCVIYEFGTDRQDLTTLKTYDAAGVPSGSDTVVHYPFVVSLGRVGRVDHDGRVLCSDVAVRRRQLSKNVDDESGAATLTAIVRSEGEGLKYFDASETDVEFSDTILNSQIGVSENTTSTLNTMELGSTPTGTSSPLMSSEYFDSYARVHTPDEEGRSIYVDLYSKATDQPLRVDISEVRVYGTAKGGSQREQS
jgi:hypothetical protein